MTDYAAANALFRKQKAAGATGERALNDLLPYHQYEELTDLIYPTPAVSC